MNQLLRLEEPRAVALFGGPGNGKTTLAREVARHTDIEKTFGARRHFVQLEHVSNVQEFASALSLALGLTPPLLDPGHPGPYIGKLLPQLGPSPALIVLDNMETIFEVDREGIERELSELGGASHIAIIVTIRGSDLPLAPRWTMRQEVGPLREDAATALFKDIAPHVDSTSLSFQKFSRALGGIPLAVELVAAEADSSVPLEVLWEEWERIGTAVAKRRGTGAGRLNSLDHSLAFSINSVRRSPHSKRMLSLVAHLPNGADLEFLKAVFGPDFYETARDVVGSCLAFQASSRIYMLPPIRTHITTHHLLTEANIRSCVYYYGERFKEILRQMEGVAPAAFVLFLAAETANCAEIFLRAVVCGAATAVIEILKDIRRIVFVQARRLPRSRRLIDTHILMLGLVKDLSSDLAWREINSGRWEDAVRHSMLSQAALYELILLSHAAFLAPPRAGSEGDPRINESLKVGTDNTEGPMRDETHEASGPWDSWNKLVTVGTPEDFEAEAEQTINTMRKHGLVWNSENFQEGLTRYHNLQEVLLGMSDNPQQAFVALALGRKPSLRVYRIWSRYEANSNNGTNEQI